MTKKQNKQSGAKVIDDSEKVPLPAHARDIEPVLSKCNGCRGIKPCYSYHGTAGGGFNFYCVDCRPVATVPTSF